MSEHLEGLSNRNKGGGFAACACLDMVYTLDDKKLFEDITNDYDASDIIIEYYHVTNNDAIYTHDDETIVTSFDDEYSKEYIDDYSKIIKYERNNNTIAYRDNGVLMLIILLRDRYFPSFITDLIKS